MSSLKRLWLSASLLQFFSCVTFASERHKKLNCSIFVLIISKVECLELRVAWYIYPSSLIQRENDATSYYCCYHIQWELFLLWVSFLFSIKRKSVFDTYLGGLTWWEQVSSQMLNSTALQDILKFQKSDIFLMFW